MLGALYLVHNFLVTHCTDPIDTQVIMNHFVYSMSRRIYYRAEYFRLRSLHKVCILFPCCTLELNPISPYTLRDSPTEQYTKQTQHPYHKYISTLILNTLIPQNNSLFLAKIAISFLPISTILKTAIQVGTKTFQNNQTRSFPSLVELSRKICNIVEADKNISKNYGTFVNLIKLSSRLTRYTIGHCRSSAKFLNSINTAPLWRISSVPK